VQSLGQAIKLWDKTGASIDLVADAWELTGKAYDGMGKKHKGDAREAFQKADALRKGLAKGPAEKP
jgi:hypothetical protein